MKIYIKYNGIELAGECDNTFPDATEKFLELATMIFNVSCETTLTERESDD